MTIATLWQLIRYGVIGGAASATYAVVAFVLIGHGGWRPAFASAGAYVVAIPVSYLGQKYFTFRSRQRSWHELGRFLVVQLFNLLLAAVIMHVACETFKLDRLWGIVAVVAVIPIATYAMLALAVFRSGDRA
jgi:putative flippase GtrA